MKTNINVFRREWLGCGALGVLKTGPNEKNIERELEMFSQKINFRLVIIFIIVANIYRGCESSFACCVY